MATNERKIAGVSQQELERRWKLVRDHLRERKIDALIAVSTDAPNNSGYTRWLTDATGAYRHVVVFHANDLMTVVEHGFHGTRREVGGKDAQHPGVGEILNVAEFPAVNYNQRYEAEAIVEMLKRRGYSRVALINPDGMPWAFVEMVKGALAGKGEVTDETEAYDHWRAIKSAEEKDFIMQAIRMQDAVFQKVLEKTKPGMRDLEVASIIYYEGRLLGSTHGTIMAGSAPNGQPAPILPPNAQGRTFQRGDYMAVLLENTGPGGYFAEVARPISLGKPSDELLENFEKVKAAQAYSTSLMKPGADCREIFASYNKYMKQHGLPVEGRIHSHAQGYDIVQRPLIRFDEPMKLEADMFFAVHPAASSPTNFTFVCDNLFITKEGNSGWLHTTERKVFEI
ncbi:MAG: aminopeptidase P family protein [Betaproteobacteria bacterium]|nr:aminopeptidase P family protein [Betaproteobacteria bacterium]